MSSIASWSYTAKATIWHCIGEDEYGKKRFSAPVVIACDYGLGSNVRVSDIGRGLFVKNIFWTEYAQAKEGDYILVGEVNAINPILAGASEILRISQDADTFERQADDYVLITGQYGT